MSGSEKKHLFSKYDLRRLESHLAENSQNLVSARVEFLPLSKFHNLSFQETEISQCDLKNTTHKSIEWFDSSFDSCSFMQSCIEQASFHNNQFQSCDFRNCEFTNLTLTSTLFNSCEVSYTHWKHCLFSQKESLFHKCPLSNVQFLDCVFDGLNFLDFTEEEFETLQFQGCYFLRCQLRVSQVERIKKSNIHLAGYKTVVAENPKQSTQVSQIPKQETPAVSQAPVTPKQIAVEPRQPTVAESASMSRFKAIESFDAENSKEDKKK
jgi:uncharacterized protein YjbI with pentapeptide repeats